MVTVKVDVVGRKNQRMDPDRLTLDQQRFKRLNGKPVQSRSSVEQNRMTSSHLFEDVPDLRFLRFDHFLSATDRMDVSQFFQPADDEGLEEHERHLLRQTALVQFEFRTDHDNGTT